MSKFVDYNETDILYTLLSYVNISSTQDVYYTIAYTVLTNLEEIPTMNIGALANLCFTSPATISRFCKEIGCKNYIGFKEEVLNAIEQSHLEINLPKDVQTHLNQDSQLLVDKIYDETIQSLQMAKDSVNIHDIDKMCQMIHDTKKVYLIGYQFNRIVANDIQMKLLKLKKFMFSFVHKGDEIQKLDIIDQDTLVIILTVRARQPLLDRLIESASKNHPSMMMITMNETYNHPSLDYIYRLKGFDSTYTGSSMMGSIDFLSLLNLIYVRYGMLYEK